MKSDGAVGRLVTGLAAIGLLGGCASGASSTATASSPASTNATSGPSIGAPTPTPRSTSTVVAEFDIAYESANPVLVPSDLDVYAPVEAGPWPVVVMLHAPGWWGELGEHARRVADLGFVVFVPTWGRGRSSNELPTFEEAVALGSQAACAVAFARTNAVAYGGDPSTMIVFGHSGGANVAAKVAFARPDPTAGCLGGATLGQVDALVTWEGDWLLSREDAGWDPVVAADPRIMDAMTPWKDIANHPDLKVVMLLSEHPGVDIGHHGMDPWAADSWLAVRDPSGDLRRQLDANRVFEDGALDVAELQQLLYSVLQAQGNPITLDVMSESSHEFVVGGGWAAFLAAFQKAAGRT